jgi:hypothetical protein
VPRMRVVGPVAALAWGDTVPIARLADALVAAIPPGLPLGDRCAMRAGSCRLTPLYVEDGPLDRRILPEISLSDYLDLLLDTASRGRSRRMHCLASRRPGGLLGRLGS